MSYQTPSIDIIAGENPCARFPAGTYTGLELDSLIVREKTVLSTLTCARVENLSSGTNEVTSRRFNGVELQPGEYINAGKGRKITGLVVVSGSVMGY
jgi:hypothetical protein